MRSFEEALNLLAYLSKDLAKLEKQQKEILGASNLNPGDKAERADRIADDITKKKTERIQVLRDLVLFPPHHLQYDPHLQEFCKDSPSSTSVFIMTKYPDKEDPVKDGELQRVIDAVTAAVKECHFHPRLASAKKYHQNLWENVELYLLACHRGIAIVEDKFKPQLNPNVAMEWGWMRAMSKNVLYLVEKDVKVVPADVNGLIKDRFDWTNPEPDVRTAVFVELTGTPPPAAATKA